MLEYNLIDWSVVDTFKGEIKTHMKNTEEQ